MKIEIKRAAKVAAASAAVLAFLGGGLAMASHRFGPVAGWAALESGGFEPPILNRIARKLDLTADQKSEIREIVADHWKNGLRDASEEARTAHRTARHVIRNPKASEDEVRQAVRSLLPVDEKFAVERHKTVVDVLAVLGDQQKGKAKEIVEDVEQTGDEIFEKIDRFLGRI